MILLCHMWQQLKTENGLLINVILYIHIWENVPSNK